MPHPLSMLYCFAGLYRPFNMAGVFCSQYIIALISKKSIYLSLSFYRNFNENISKLQVTITILYIFMLKY
ncbi:hypothetical protein A2526_01500 [candidate division WOR-1 bacterium RIFOXYD2_FULL_36_8]|uniref:Uncharacterized protein n=1 Tax=candidate division WOR-1 bacterium RIFOXYB2_FULL_36_35 TaxID=1802578 RepID=A0A1F4S1Q7_UNCSA|nr:MAG: hypothetical protein A2230_05225 [candidate division WOR-1 bacterium RIFOXYA2_FULL_36_21]OGC14327.1 MAG: hypothetical protein A2290_08305 [candidate division WOR-1 bacterium RIFOXYB2_FULL_36_35]OGC19641.1 MAG: hypothetical protein A2282_02780 [candidate division WOR-1 bacterium RIFOXYA12_FULL_36_13]OGC40679.1 MAG: hypothetical protein A2526_01500 [candidate division WOR-1 bacterium RIFOXYD2_FULL_36_8]